MLQQDCIIAKGTTGLNPDTTDYNDEKAIKRWLSKHPEKKKPSVERQNINKENIKKALKARGIMSDEVS